MLPVLAANGASGYNLTNSLRFRQSASASLTRTAGTPTSQNIHTSSFWYKKGSNPNGVIWGARNGTTTDAIYDLNGVVYVQLANSNVIVTTALFRDYAAWYHFVLKCDGTNTTLYVNNQQVGTTATASTYLNRSGSTLAFNQNASVNYNDMYLAEVNFVDGQSLNPSSFGSTDSVTGVWIPKKYTGTYGTNGFYLNFSNIALTSGSNTGLGKDYSGNGNYFNTNNISVTSGTTYDAMTDVPTLTSATVANYAVLNPLDKNTGITVSDGNLNITTPSGACLIRGTIGITSGKWYWEMTAGSTNGLQNVTGIATSLASLNNFAGSDAFGWGYYGWNGKTYNNATQYTYGATYASGDVIGTAFDADAGTLTFYKNNVSQGTAFTGLTNGPYFPAGGDADASLSATSSFNFGQRPFAYTPPTGYVALNTYNLPTPTILKSNKVFDATLYTGTGSTLSVTNAGAFKPDLVWFKDRSIVSSHRLSNSIAGAGLSLYSNLTNAETALNDPYVTAFNSNGFSATTTNGDAYVGWQWQAGQGTTSSNTNGSITSTVSVNTTAGFSIVTYTGTGANATVGHGLGVAPKFIVIKNRTSGTVNWVCYHASLGATKGIYLNLTDASTTDGVWQNTSPTSTVFSVSSAATNANGSGNSIVAYCWAEIAGFSKFGSYTGNGSTDGTFVYTGFRPKFVMTKMTSAVGGWIIFDTSRNTYNVVGNELYPNSSAAEGTGYTDMDILSNGFKLRVTGDPNASGNTFIFAAFAENPFKYSNAR